jgi:DNA-binding transcriptional MerR regulator
MIRQIEVVQDLGVTPRSLRVWEDAGLLGSVARNDRDHRTYTADQVDRVRMILVGQMVGLTLDEMKEILDLWSMTEERKMRARVREHVERLEFLLPPEYDL